MFAGAYDGFGLARQHADRVADTLRERQVQNTSTRQRNNFTLDSLYYPRKKGTARPCTQASIDTALASATGESMDQRSPSCSRYNRKPKQSSRPAHPRSPFDKAGIPRRRHADTDTDRDILADFRARIVARMSACPATSLFSLPQE